MHRRLFETLGTLAALAVVTVAGCKKDPLSDLDGNPAAVLTNFSYLQLGIGDQASVTAQIIDARATPLAVPITFSPCTGDVTVVTDTSYHPVPATSARAIVTAVSANPSCVVVAGGGVTDTVTVAILPAAFNGTLSSTTPAGGDTLTITSSTTLKFDPATVSVVFGGGTEGLIASKTADVVKVLVPFGAAGPLTINGIAVTYIPGLVVSLPTSASVTQTGDRWVGDNAFATAPAIALPTAVGGETYVLTNLPATNNADQCAETAANFDFGSTGPCTIYSFTVAAPTRLKFIVDWDSGADLDTYSCSAADPMSCFEDSGSGATGAQPQEFEFTYPAGTHYFVVENYDGVATTNIFATIRRTQ